MVGTDGDEWVYVLSPVTATAVGEDESNKPSKNPDDDDGETAAAEEEKESNAADNDKKASAQPSELDSKAAPSSSSESKDGGAQSDSDDEAEYPDWYTPEEVEIDKAFDAYMAALDRALARKFADVELDIEIDRAYEAYVAALDRRAAAKIDGRLIDSRLIDEALRTYRAACKRAAKILDAGASSNSNAGGGRGPRAVTLHPCYAPYNDGNHDDTDGYGGAAPGPYYGGGSSAPASLSLGSGYDYTCYNRYGFGFPGDAYGSGYGYEYYDGYYGYGFPGAAYGPAIGSYYSYGFGYPGAAYGPATGYGYGGYAEPYYASYVPAGYQTTAVYLAPPPALYATTSELRYSARADEPSPPAVAAPTTQPPPEPSCSLGMGSVNLIT